MKTLLTGLAMLIMSCAFVLAADSGSAASVSIKNGFSPARLSIKAGDTVTWTNNDDRDHDIAAADGSFDSGNLKSGQTFSHAFPTPGTYPYTCTLHPREKGVIVVK